MAIQRRNRRQVFSEKSSKDAQRDQNINHFIFNPHKRHRSSDHRDREARIFSFFSPGSSQVEGRLNLNLFDRVVKNVYKETSQSAWALQICQIRPTQGLIGRFYTTRFILQSKKLQNVSINTFMAPGQVVTHSYYFIACSIDQFQEVHPV